jgi:hypothetical protein
MKRFLPLFALLLGLVLSCKEKPDPEKPVEMLLDSQAANLEFTPSADPQTLHFELYCDGLWDMREEGMRANWVESRTVTALKKNTWSISIQITENTASISRRTVFVLYSDNVERRVVIVQSVEDPIFRVHDLGAYGVPGGDVIFDKNRFQYSCLKYGPDAMSVRFLEPEEARVTTLGGLKRNLETGMQFPIMYRVVEQGYTRILETIPVQVIRVRDSMVWLKKDDNEYFVIRK